MWIMEAVWPITALYFGPLALWGYIGGDVHRATSGWRSMATRRRSRLPPRRPWGVSHCGAGCTLGDIIGSPAVVFLFSWKLFGLFLYAKFVVN
jgi:hypothetical protein